MIFKLSEPRIEASGPLDEIIITATKNLNNTTTIKNEPTEDNIESIVPLTADVALSRGINEGVPELKCGVSFI